MLPLFICKVACSAGRSWCRSAGSWSSAGEGNWADGGAWLLEDEEEDDMLEGVEPIAAAAGVRLWEEEEEEEWPQLAAADWSTDAISVETSSDEHRRNSHYILWMYECLSWLKHNYIHMTKILLVSRTCCGFVLQGLLSVVHVPGKTVCCHLDWVFLPLFPEAKQTGFVKQQRWC